MKNAVHFHAILGVTMLVFAASPVGSAEVEGLAGHPSVRPSISTAKVLETLGPGPLALHREAIERPRVKAATVEDAIDQCVQANMASLNAPGAAVAVILDGELLYESGYGVKRRTLTGAVAADTIFRIGSVTKQITAAVVMQQVELGRVDLGSPVTDYIPEFEVSGKWPADRITVRHALTHTTGYPDRINDVTSVGDYRITDNEGATTQATVYLEGDRLMGSIIDPSLPGFTYTTEIEQVFLDTFLFDSDGDGAADTDITFCSQKGDPGFMMWMRNRLAVGERQLTPRTAGRAMSP